jgi:hypothetical protein
MLHVMCYDITRNAHGLMRAAGAPVPSPKGGIDFLPQDEKMKADGTSAPVAEEAK